MELILYIIIAILATANVLQFLTKNVLKTATTKGIKEMQDVYTEMIADLKQENKILKKQKAGLQSWVNDERTEEGEQEQAINPLVQALAQKYGIPTEMLNDPAIKKMVKKYEHLLPLAAKFLPANSDQMESASGQKGITYV
jgi:hypothetical protein